MDTRKFAIKQAVKLVSTLSIENKTKAVFDLATEIEKWIIYVQQKPKEYPVWFGAPIPCSVPDHLKPPYKITCGGNGSISVPVPEVGSCILTISGYSDSRGQAYTNPSKDYDAVQASIAMSDILYGEKKLDDKE